MFTSKGKSISQKKRQVIQLFIISTDDGQLQEVFPLLQTKPADLSYALPVYCTKQNNGTTEYCLNVVFICMFQFLLSNIKTYFSSK